MRPALTLVLLGFLILSGHPAWAAKATADDVAALLSSDPVVLDGEHLDGTRLHALYERRVHLPLWMGNEDGEGRVALIAGVLADADAHGLDPKPYHTTAIARRRPPADARQAAELDVLASDALMRYVADMHGGRLAPVRPGREVDLPPRPLDIVEAVDTASGTFDLATWLGTLPPQQPRYEGLRRLLARYRGIAAKGGWPRLPDGPTLRRGVTDPAVVVLRRRLAASGDLPVLATASPRFDAPLAAGVAAFQRRHGLPGDGVVGTGTREALDVDVGTRIDQIVANLERLRWLPEDLGTRHVAVNVPAFTAQLVEDGTTVLEMPVVVGRPDRMTPIISSQITRITFNPSWTVPETIAREDIVHKVHADARYLEREGMQVFGGPKGARHEVSPRTVNWSLAGTPAYVLRQPPGPTNPLGRLRFDIPNVNAIYLHDSPKRDPFRKPVRALSSGCIRVGDARGLAAHILADVPEWTAERQEEALAGWETRRVTLRNPVPVHVLYETAWVDEGGTAHFREDIYGRDRRLVDALRGRPAARLETMAAPVGAGS